MQPKRFIRRPELVKKIGLGPTTIHHLERAGQFPRHILLTPRCAVWDLEAVEAWMKARFKTPAIGAAVPDARKRVGNARSA
jgi:prophage regulatory protein